MNKSTIQYWLIKLNITYCMYCSTVPYFTHAPNKTLPECSYISLNCQQVMCWCTTLKTMLHSPAPLYALYLV